MWTFGTVLWSALVFFFWFAVVWMFIAIFADIFRRDMSGWAKGGWIALLVLVPFLGALVYCIAVPRSTDRMDTLTVGDYGTPAYTGNYHPADEIAKAAQLQDQGKISAADFEQIKREALSH
jgi:hypothetical protein